LLKNETKKNNKGKKKKVKNIYIYI